MRAGLLAFNLRPLEVFYSLYIAKMKQLEIRGDLFKFKKFDIVRNWKTDISDLYEKPSKEKKDAFNEREGKLAKIYGLVGGIQNYSIYGEIIDEEGKRHDVKITKSNNFILNQ